MARKLIHPDLDRKFQLAVRRVFQDHTASLSGRELVEKALAVQDDLPQGSRVSEDEAAYLRKNPSNFLTRAKIADVIESAGGPWQGYSLKPPRSESADSPASAQVLAVEDGSDAETSSELGQLIRRVPQLQWEGFLHFPTTIALGKDAVVASLPKKLSGNKWGNPDMLVLRGGYLEELVAITEGNLQPEQQALFAKLTNATEYVLESIELKFFEQRVSRDGIYTAVAETVANGQWANETWLLFYQATTSSESESASDFRTELVEQARKFGVGVRELVVQNGLLQIRTLAASDARGQIDASALRRMSREPNELLLRVHAMLERYSNWTAPDEQRDLADLIEAAARNLSAQSGFGGRSRTASEVNPPSSWTEQLAALRESNSSILAALADASIATLVSYASAQFPSPPQNRRLDASKLDFLRAQRKIFNDVVSAFGWSVDWGS